MSSTNTRNVRTSEVAHLDIDHKLEKANERRAKKKKPALSKSKAVEAAIKSMTVKQLVEA